LIERQGSPTYTPDRPALPDISSTDIRARLATGKSTQGRLSAHVRSYIEAQRLYALDA
jgi:nicotinic acid mononucleotide adenylyltransferase